MATIDKVCKEEVNSFILFDPDIIKGLYRRGLIYFDVPVFPDDRFKGNSIVPIYSFIFFVFYPYLCQMQQLWNKTESFLEEEK